MRYKIDMIIDADEADISEITSKLAEDLTFSFFSITPLDSGGEA